MKLAKPKALKDCETVVDFAYRERYVYLTEVDNFRKTFGENLLKFWDSNLTGFDDVAFDRWIKAGDRGLKDVIAEQFGEEGTRIIETLLHIGENTVEVVK